MVRDFSMERNYSLLVSLGLRAVQDGEMILFVRYFMLFALMFVSYCFLDRAKG